MVLKLLFIALGVANCTCMAEELLLNVEIKGEPHVDGPIELELTLKNVGDSDINAMPFSKSEIIFEAPAASWKLHQQTPGTLMIVGMRKPKVLAKGAAWSRTIYLHDYFDNIASGKFQIPVSTKVNKGNDTVLVKTTLEIDIPPPDEAAFPARLQAIQKLIEFEKDSDKRLEIYKSVVSLPTFKVIPLMIKALLEPDYNDFYPVVRERLFAVCHSKNDYQPIVDYLVSHGGRFDFEFFDMFHDNRIHLSLDQLNEMVSGSLWIRLYTIRTFATDSSFQEMNVNGIVESLTNEVKELKDEVDNLKVKKFPPKFFDDTTIKPPKPPEPSRQTPKVKADGDF